MPVNMISLGAPGNIRPESSHVLKRVISVGITLRAEIAAPRGENAMLIQNRAIENVIFIVFPSLVLPGKAKGKPERLLPNIACAKDVLALNSVVFMKQRCSW